MRRSIVPIALVLALTTGAVLGQTRSLFAPVALFDGTNLGARTEPVRRFYTAVDEFLDGGGAVSLKRVVASDYLEHTNRPGVESTRAGLIRYLTSLRTAFPSLRLSPLDLVAQHDRVVARVGVAGATGGDFLGIPFSGDGIWGGIDIFRVEGGQIAEHWGDQRGRFLLEPLATKQFTGDSIAGKIVALERRSYAAAASVQEVATEGAIFLFVESGALTVELDYRSPAPAALVRNPIDGRIATSDLFPDDVTTLQAGEVLALAAGAPFTTRNDERDPAMVVAVTIMDLPSPETAAESHPAVATAGVTSEVLASSGLFTPANGSSRLGVGRATLAPRSELSLHPTTGTELVAVDSGSLTLVVPQGSAWMHTSVHSAVTAHEYEEVPAGQGVAVAPGATVAYRNDGSSPLVVFVVTVESAR